MKWLGVLVWVCACGPKAVPDSFVFGAAVAGFQVEPGCPTLPADECEDRRSDWYQWVTSPEALSDLSNEITFEPLSNGPGQWELYEQDFERASSELGVDSFRLSLEWSRVFPAATDGLTGEALSAVANRAALDRYHAMFAALKARGLKPFVTLNHSTLPVWVHDGVACHQHPDTCVNRGWLDHDRIVNEITKYAAFCAQEFAAEVDFWATLNEPFAVVLPAYLLPSKARANPPGLTFKTLEAKAAMTAMIDAHARMYDAIKAADRLDADHDGTTSVVGLVYSTTPTVPKDPANAVDVRGASNVDYLYNTAFLNAVIKGVVDADLDGVSDGPVRADLVNRMQYLGVNYYTRITVAGTGAPTLPGLSPLTTFDPISLTLAPYDPRGIYDAISTMNARYALPMYVTETGIDTAGDPTLNAQWLVNTMTWVKRAIRDGADVRGYFAWSLVDNYEWNQGMNARFGLYEVSPDAAKTRTPRQAMSAYRDIVKARDVPAKWLTKYPAFE